MLRQLVFAHRGAACLFLGTCKRSIFHPKACTKLITSVSIHTGQSVQSPPEIPEVASTKKRIVICADGTWNRPEEDPEDQATNVLKIARAVKPFGDDGVPQQVFYDWGLGSYHDSAISGATGKGIHKNIVDGYRYIVHNYSPEDEIYVFGFSRGAYTVRSLCGLINNCGILKRTHANHIVKAFDHYQKLGADWQPNGAKAIQFRDSFSHPDRSVHFVGVWDTVGALGIPLSFLGLMDPSDEFFDTKMGENIRCARHALALDELREDFEPTIWIDRDKETKQGMQQVWFPGVHSNIGGSYVPDLDGGLLSDIPLKWIATEASKQGLTFEKHLASSLHPKPTAKLHNSRNRIYRMRPKYHRPIDHGQGEILIHSSVQERWNTDTMYRPENLERFLINNNGWPTIVD